MAAAAAPGGGPLRPPSPCTTAGTDGGEHDPDHDHDHDDADAELLAYQGDIHTDIALAATVLREVATGSLDVRSAAEMMHSTVANSPTAAGAAAASADDTGSAANGGGATDPADLTTLLDHTCTLFTAASQQLHDKDHQLQRAVEFGNALIEKTKVQAEEYKAREIQVQAERNALEAEVAMWKGWDGTVLMEGELTEVEGEMLRLKRYLQGKVSELQLRLQEQILKNTSLEDAMQELREEAARLRDEATAVGDVNERLAGEMSTMRVARQKLEVSLHILETKMNGCSKCKHTAFNSLPVYDAAAWERHAGGSEYAVMETYLNTPSHSSCAPDTGRPASRPPSPLLLHAAQAHQQAPLPRTASSTSIASSPVPAGGHAQPRIAGGLNSLFTQGKSPKPDRPGAHDAEGGVAAAGIGGKRDSARDLYHRDQHFYPSKHDSGVNREEYYKLLEEVNKSCDAQARLRKQLDESEEERAALQKLAERSAERCGQLEASLDALRQEAAGLRAAAEAVSSPTVHTAVQCDGGRHAADGAATPTGSISPRSPVEDLGTQLHWHELHEEIESLSTQLVVEKSKRVTMEASHTAEIADLRASFIEHIRTPRGSKDNIELPAMSADGKPVPVPPAIAPVPPPPVIAGGKHHKPGKRPRGDEGHGAGDRAGTPPPPQAADQVASPAVASAQKKVRTSTRPAPEASPAPAARSGSHPRTPTGDGFCFDAMRGAGASAGDLIAKFGVLDGSGSSSAAVAAAAGGGVHFDGAAGSPRTPGQPPLRAGSRRNSIAGKGKGQGAAGGGTGDGLGINFEMVPLLPLGLLQHRWEVGSTGGAGGGDGAATAQDRHSQLESFRTWLGEAEARIKELGLRNQRAYWQLHNTESQLNVKILEVERLEAELATVQADATVYKEAAAEARAALKRERKTILSASEEADRCRVQLDEHEAVANKALAAVEAQLTAANAAAAASRDARALLEKELAEAKAERRDLVLRAREADAERAASVERADDATTAQTAAWAAGLAAAAQQLRVIDNNEVSERGAPAHAWTAGAVLQQLVGSTAATAGSSGTGKSKRKASKGTAVAADLGSPAVVCAALPPVLLSLSLLDAHAALGDACLRESLAAVQVLHAGSLRVVAAAAADAKAQAAAAVLPSTPVHRPYASPAGAAAGLAAEAGWLSRGWALLGAFVTMIFSIILNYFTQPTCPPQLPDPGSP